MKRVDIAGRTIGPAEPPYVIAEMSGNHGGELARAMAVVEAAASAGADAIKLQAYTADSLTLDSDSEPFVISSGSHWDGRTLHDLYTEAATPWEWMPELKRTADSLGLGFFSSVFDTDAVAFLDELGAPAFKVASAELVDLPLIESIAQTGKPVIISTGMASLPEIEDAVAAVRDVAADAAIVLLKCTAAYPAAPEELNLATIADLAARFSVPVGFSDHTVGSLAAVTAVGCGATMIEKHVCVSRAEAGSDAHFSMEPDEFADFVSAIRTAAAARGAVSYGPTPGESQSLPFRRSLFIVEDVAAGGVLTTSNVRSVRPANGLPPKHLGQVLGRKAARDLKRGAPLTWEDLE